MMTTTRSRKNYENKNGFVHLLEMQLVCERCDVTVLDLYVAVRNELCVATHSNRPIVLPHPPPPKKINGSRKMFCVTKYRRLPQGVF
jgi:hypothetical protein